MTDMRGNMRIAIAKAFAIFGILISAFIMSSCQTKLDKNALKVIIIPKFEIGQMSEDFPGEAQLFYERYCMGCEEVEIAHMPPTAHFYFNNENGVGILLTGSGKTAAGLSLATILSSELFDYSDASIVSVGCSGGNSEQCTLGDVVLITAVCDYDLGHHVDAHERQGEDPYNMWFPDDSYADYEYEFLNAELCDKAYKLIKDVNLATTEQAKEVMLDNFSERKEEDILPKVRRGTAISADNFWKGVYGHATASFISDYYDCPDPYSVTEMEEIAIANVAECYDLLDRMLSLRVIVNMDVFLKGETPENIWGEYKSFNEKVKSTNTETIDIFEPAMHNLYDASSIIIDAILDGRL